MAEFIMILLWIFLRSASSQTPEITGTTNYSIGDEFLLSCSASNTVDSLLFLVDGLPTSDQIVSDNGFTQSLAVMNGDTLTTTLIGIAQIQHNETNISCVAIDFMEGNTFSEVIVLLVQGPLSSVGSLLYTVINSTTINITWSPPFTLPGTNIIGYNITTNTNNITVDHFTSDNSIIIDIAKCNTTIISVSGYNGLEGENDTIIKNPNVELFLTSVNITMEINETTAIELNINVSNQCPQFIPNSVNITILYSSNDTIADTYNNIALIVLSTDILSTGGVITIPSNQNYTAIIQYSNEEQGVINTTNEIEFDSFSLQSIALTDVIGPVIEIVCQFSPNTNAVGCVIELILLSDNSIHYISSSNRVDDQAIVTFTGIVIGNYQYRVFERETDQSLTLVSEDELTILPEPVQITTTTNTNTIATTTTGTIAATTSGTSVENTSTDTPNFSSINSITPTETEPSTSPIRNNVAIIGGVIGAIIIILVIIIIGIVIAYCVKRNFDSKDTIKNSAAESKHETDENNGKEPEDISLNANNTDGTGSCGNDDAYLIDNTGPIAEAVQDSAITNTIPDTTTDDHTATTNPTTGYDPANNTYEDVMLKHFKSESRSPRPVANEKVSEEELQKILSKNPKDIIYAELQDVEKRCLPRVHEGLSVYADIKPPQSDTMPPSLPPKKRKNTSSDNSSTML